MVIASLTTAIGISNTSVNVGRNSSFGQFHTIPSNVSKLNEVMCGPLNRTGVLCSHCQQGLGPAVFSYYRECKECLVYPYGWILFFVRFIIPSTVFCVLVIAFRINVASPALNAFVIAAKLSTLSLATILFLLPMAPITSF